MKMMTMRMKTNKVKCFEYIGLQYIVAAAVAVAADVVDAVESDDWFEVVEKLMENADCPNESRNR